MFDSTQRANIKKYLGFPLTFNYVQERIENALDLVGAQPDGYNICVNILTLLVDIENRLNTTALDVAGIEAIGAEDPTFYRSQVDADLRRAGRVQVSRLSIVLGVPAVNDYFGTAGYENDSFMSRKFNGFVPI